METAASADTIASLIDIDSPLDQPSDTPEIVPWTAALANRPALPHIAGAVLQSHPRPLDCPAFAIRCTPDRPLGAPMVSSEGTCAAYYRYRRHGGGPHGA